MSVIYLEEWREKLASISTSQYRSTQNTKSDELGPIPTDEEMAGMVAIYMTLMKAWQSPFTTKSDFSRYAADIIAVCASEQLISTKIDEESYGNKWLITEDGLVWMKGFDDAYPH